MVLDPASPVEMIEYVLHFCDIIFVMTVNPGFSGQKFLPEMLPKIRRVRDLCDARGLNLIIEVDGVGTPTLQLERSKRAQMPSSRGRQSLDRMIMRRRLSQSEIVRELVRCRRDAGV